MAFFNKLNNFANAASEKASGAIELGRLNLKLNTEERKMEDITLQIGKCLLQSLDAGQEYDEAIMDLYEEIQTARAAVVSIKAELANVSGSLICPSCSTKNSPESKFCRACGTKLEADPPEEEAPIEIVEVLCPNCGATVDSDVKFCTQCGTKLD